jgi:GWxTD domain-containing protein
MNYERSSGAFLTAAAALTVLVLAAACGINSMPTKDVWFTQHYIIMQDYERSAYRSLNEAGKLAFRDLFWSVRTPDARATYEARLQYVKDNYWKENSRQPWNTDRSRIYLLNGSPASIDVDQNNNWAMSAMEGAATGAAGVSDRSHEDVGANTGEIWTYQYNQNLIQYAFAFVQPNQWRQVQVQFAGNRFLGDFETYSRTVVFGVENPEKYQEEIAKLEKK